MPVEPSSTPISIRGRYFWRGDDRFFVRGLVYRPENNDSRPDEVNDPISDSRVHELERNISLFTELGINTLFVYFIDNEKPHDKAMKLLERAGIYVVVTVATPYHCINRHTPYKSYNTTNVASFFRTAAIMSGYPNTLGLAAADATVNGNSSLHATPIIKAVIRDLKRYLRWSHEKNGTRVLPVSYSAADVLAITRPPGFLEYLYLGEEASAIDFWMTKNYSWVGELSMAMSGWDSFLSRYEKFAIPAFLSEYGGKTAKPRQFYETRALYSSPMTGVFSGGCVYQFTSHYSKYGLVALPGADNNSWFERSNVVETRETDEGNLYIYSDFENYKAALAETSSNHATWTAMEHGSADRHKVDTSQMTWPWGSEYQMPETCIDWDNIEELIGSVLRSSVETTTHRLGNTSIS